MTEYWLVDPESESVRVYRRGAIGFDQVRELRAAPEDTLATPLLPGFSLPLTALFRW